MLHCDDTQLLNMPQTDGDKYVREILIAHFFIDPYFQSFFSIPHSDWEKYSDIQREEKTRITTSINSEAFEEKNRHTDGNK